MESIEVGPSVVSGSPGEARGYTVGARREVLRYRDVDPETAVRAH